MKALDWRSLISIASRASEEEKRRLLLDGIYRVVENWQGPLPDLLEIFRPEKIECLLSYAVTDQEGDEEARIRFIKFVVDSGYRDQPKIGPDGRYVLHRTTPIHLVLRAKIDNWDATATNMVQLLFEIYNRFDLNFIDEAGFTHFQAACSIPDGHQLVWKMINRRQNPNSLLRSALLNAKWAVELLIRGADPTWVDTDGSTALHTICRDNRLDLLKLFFKIVDKHRKAVQINVRDSLGNTPLHLAVKNGYLKTSEILLTRGADPNSANQEGSTPLHIICRDGRSNLLKLFFKIANAIGYPVWVNVSDKEGNTPLHLTISHKSMKNSEILLVNGANPNLADKNGYTALHLISNTRPHAVMQQFFEIVDKKQQTVQIDARDNKGWTPLHMVVHLGSRSKFQLLLSRGADPNVTNQDGQTPLSLALFNANTKMADDLLWADADPNSADKEGWTPLHVICVKCTWFLETFFRINAERQQPVEINAKTIDGRTPLNLLMNRTNYQEASRYLEALGARLD
ncbi:ankyrin-3-like [Trichogramma pretiosum]|uniref:ankyrin-3-like n=1 Tax=Trichogramma pretiosum TaxID=7493 RepID=UPI000C71B5DE|nr:ankyrin-3-like [Trichogramma pretiosum]